MQRDKLVQAVHQELLVHLELLVVEVHQELLELLVVEVRLAQVGHLEHLAHQEQVELPVQAEPVHRELLEQVD